MWADDAESFPDHGSLIGMGGAAGPGVLGQGVSAGSAEPAGLAGLGGDTRIRSGDFAG